MSDAQPLLLDTDSTNGTMINGARVTESALRVGDLVLMGSTLLRYEAAPNP